MPTKSRSTRSSKARTTASKSSRSSRAKSAPRKAAGSRAQTRSASHRPAGRASSSRRATQSKSGTASRQSGRSQNLSQTTIDHEEIRRWAEERGAHPACVRRTGRGKGDVGMIRLDFPGFSGEKSLQPISWDEFFEAFDHNNLALVYQEKTARGQRSNFNKLVSREANK